MRVPHLVPNKHRPLNKEEKSTQKVSGGLFESKWKSPPLTFWVLSESKQASKWGTALIIDISLNKGDESRPTYKNLPTSLVGPW